MDLGRPSGLLGCQRAVGASQIHNPAGWGGIINHCRMLVNTFSFNFTCWKDKRHQVTHNVLTSGNTLEKCFMVLSVPCITLMDSFFLTWILCSNKRCRDCETCVYFENCDFEPRKSHIQGELTGLNRKWVWSSNVTSGWILWAHVALSWTFLAKMTCKISCFCSSRISQCCRTTSQGIQLIDDMFPSIKLNILLVIQGNVSVVQWIGD